VFHPSADEFIHRISAGTSKWRLAQHLIGRAFLAQHRQHTIQHQAGIRWPLVEFIRAFQMPAE
jgi:hypothetical protein